MLAVARSVRQARSVEDEEVVVERVENPMMRRGRGGGGGIAGVGGIAGGRSGVGGGTGGRSGGGGVGGGTRGGGDRMYSSFRCHQCSMVCQTRRDVEKHIRYNHR